MYTLKSPAPKLYRLEAVENLIQRYFEHGGSMEELKPGSLGYGLTILYSPAENLKTFVIREVYLNEWSSGHTVRGYNRMPKKYRAMLEERGLI